MVHMYMGLGARQSRLAKQRNKKNAHSKSCGGYREYASQLFEFIHKTFGTYADGVKQSIKKKHRSKGNGQEEHQEKRE